LSVARSICPGNSIEIITFITLCDLEVRRGSIAAADALYSEAFAIYQSSSKARDELDDAFLVKLGNSSEERGQPAPAVACYRELLTRVSERCGSDAPELESVHRLLARALLGCNEMDEALSHMRQALDLTRLKSGVDQREIAYLCREFGLNLLRASHATEGMQFAETALTCLLDADEPTLPELREFYAEFAAACQRAERYDEAIVLFEEVARLTEAQFGSAAVKTSEAYIRIAECRLLLDNSAR
jgi:tetratricopeptide (TPR) repeat protein